MTVHTRSLFVWSATALLLQYWLLLVVELKSYCLVGGPTYLPPAARLPVLLLVLSVLLICWCWLACAVAAAG